MSKNDIKTVKDFFYSFMSFSFNFLLSFLFCLESFTDWTIVYYFEIFHVLENLVAEKKIDSPF
jgi:hypothetical protein